MNGYDVIEMLRSFIIQGGNARNDGTKGGWGAGDEKLLQESGSQEQIFWDSTLETPNFTIPKDTLWPSTASRDGVTASANVLHFHTFQRF